MNNLCRINETFLGVYIMNESTSTLRQYNLVEQLQKIPAQISILELLKVSPMHKEILERALP